MVTVGADGVDVERRLAAGRLGCPGCGGRLAPWGWARSRRLRGEDVLLRLRPRRARCVGCGRTHVLLPVFGLVRRADAVVVIGAALAARVGGVGHRRIAGQLGRPAGTVRGWLRRFGARVEAVRVVFTTLLCALDPDPPLLQPAGSPLADAVAAVLAAAGAVVRRWGAPVCGLSAWELAAAVTGGRLLLPEFRVESTVDSINTSCPW